MENVTCFTTRGLDKDSKNKISPVLYDRVKRYRNTAKDKMRNWLCCVYLAAYFAVTIGQLQSSNRWRYGFRPPLRPPTLSPPRRPIAPQPGRNPFPPPQPSPVAPPPIADYDIFGQESDSLSFPGSLPQRDDVIGGIQEAEEECRNERTTFRKFARIPSSAASAHHNFNKPNALSLRIQKTARALNKASKIQTRNGNFRSTNTPIPMATFRQLPGGQCFRQSLRCDLGSKFRTQDGRCNNLNQPDWGSAGQPFRRLLPPAYSDGIDAPRSFSSVGSTPLPSPRAASIIVHDVRDSRDSQHTQMLMQWGQFLDHDLTLTPESRACDGEELECSACNSQSTVSQNCFPIPIPVNDPIFVPNQCMNFRRSVNGQRDRGAREQMNQLTAYIDASNVYGSGDEDARQLRTLIGGQLRLQGNGLLPVNAQDETCNREAVNSNQFCFRAGDARVNVQVGLMSTHTLWAHQHNNIATKLASVNPHWDDKRLYQEARKIVGAMHQHITYNEFLSQVLGPQYMQQYNLRPGFSSYDPSCDATLFNEFSTAAYRFGHSLVDQRFQILNNRGQLEQWNLTGHFMDPRRLYQSPDFQNILAGISGQRCQHADRFVSNALRNHLFGSGTFNDGLDLIALNLQRGRDHGLQPYARYRERYNLPVPRSFEDLNSFMTQDTIAALRRVYRSVDDIDLFSGILCENNVAGGLVGPLAANILGEQFQNLKNCDRFYYEHPGQIGSFTPEQLSEIKRMTMRNMLCLQQPRSIAGLECATSGGILNLQLWRESPQTSFLIVKNSGRRLADQNIKPRCF